MKTSFLMAVIFITTSSVLLAQEDPVIHEESSLHTRHHDHYHFEYGPVGVMGDHIHADNDIMFSYRYMTMYMDGSRKGTSRISKSDVFAEGFTVAPTSMTMDMHMFGTMYAATDELTIMAMLPYLRKSMDHITKMGVKFTTKSEGIGDIRLTGLYKLFEQDGHHVHLNTGLSFPTGSIDKEDDTPAGSNQKLPYPMQLGSGTFDLLPGVTYLGQLENWSWGAQAIGTVRLGRNREGYSLGDRVSFTAWGQRKWTDWLSTSLRVNGQIWGKIDGDDDDLNPAMVPTADPDRSGGKRIDLLFGVGLNGREGWSKGHRLAIEFGVPIYQSLDGPQLETDWLLTAGWQYVW